MLQTLELRNSRGLLQQFTLRDISEGYVVQNIEGLDPVAATLVSSSFANIDGEQFQSARRGPRNIRLQLGLRPQPGGLTVRQLRQKLYEMAMPKTQVSLRFIHEDGLTVNIEGWVETNESPMFVREATAMISIMCYQPDFRENSITTYSGAFGLADAPSRLIPYDGTVEAGFTMVMTPLENLSGFTIQHFHNSFGSKTFTFDTSMLYLDKYHLSTVPGDKYMRRTRQNVLTSVLGAVSPYSYWPVLQPGENYFKFIADEMTVGTGGMNYQMTVQNRYGGL